jgi:hypothetical protein
VPRNNRRKQSAGPRGRTLVTVLIALCAFGVLGTFPEILSALNLHIRPVAAKTGYGVTLLPAPKSPRPVPLPPVARPVDPNQPAASLPAVDSAREAALVSSEDGRIRVLLHAAVRVYQPEILPVRASLPTLVLTAGPHTYTAADLAEYGALVYLPHHAALLVDNVFVSTNARLSLGSARLRALYMDSSTGGFATIVAWGGDLAFHGTEAQPLTIMGWDRVAKAPAADQGYGRSYIREVGGRMTFANVRVSSLGFWSGRTGGVAWTGLNGQPSTGGAVGTTFTNDTYGAFVDRGKDIRFSRDLFEFNQLDGLHIHRYSVGTSVTFSSSARNGGNGFLVGQATQLTTMRDDVAENNESNGYFIDGRPLVSGASASGSAVAPASGATIERSAALGNERTGILVEGGAGTVLRADQVCAQLTGIAVRYDATDSVITGNDVRCAPRSGLSIGPAAPGAIISGNSISGARIAMLIRSSGRVEVDNNLITGATVFGITARGLTSQVSGVGNVISGIGFRAVDARADASQPSLSDTNTTGWLHHVKITFWSYLLFHPLAALWLSILVLVLICYLWSRRRHLSPHPYPASTRWQHPDALPEPPAQDAELAELAFAGAAANRGDVLAPVARHSRNGSARTEVAAAPRPSGLVPSPNGTAHAATESAAVGAVGAVGALAPGWDWERTPDRSRVLPDQVSPSATGARIPEPVRDRVPSGASSVWERAPSGAAPGTAGPAVQADPGATEPGTSERSWDRAPIAAPAPPQSGPVPRRAAESAAFMSAWPTARSGPIPSGPVPSGPVPSGPVPSGPVPSESAPSGSAPPWEHAASVPAPSWELRPSHASPAWAEADEPVDATRPMPRAD